MQSKHVHILSVLLGTRFNQLFYQSHFGGGAMVLGKLTVPGRPTICITVWQWPTALALGAPGGCFGHFYSHLFFLSSFSLFVGGRVVRWFWVNFQFRGVLLIWVIVGQGPIALAVGAVGGGLDIFTLSILSLLFLPLSGRRPDID